jgi:hypothetical protein
MASDVVGTVHVDLSTSDRPSLGTAVVVGAGMTALVLAGMVLAGSTLLPDRAKPLRLGGQGSTVGGEPLLPGGTGLAYLVVRNDSGHKVRITEVVPGDARVRPGTASGCDPAALTFRASASGLLVGPGQSAMFTAHLSLDAAAGNTCRTAVFDLPVTALARPA